MGLFYFLVHINKCEELQDRFARLLESGKYSDVTFVIMEGSFEHRVPAHRMILASQSDDFHQLLFVEKKEAHEIHLEDTPLKAFLLLLQYAYTGRVQIASNLKVCSVDIGYARKVIFITVALH